VIGEELAITQLPAQPAFVQAIDERAGLLELFAGKERGADVDPLLPQTGGVTCANAKLLGPIAKPPASGFAAGKSRYCCAQSTRRIQWIR